MRVDYVNGIRFLNLNLWNNWIVSVQSRWSATHFKSSSHSIDFHWSVVAVICSCVATNQEESIRAYVYSTECSICLYIYISVANRSNWRQQCDALALQLFITSSSSHLPIILLLPPSNSRLKCLLTLSLHALYLNLGQTNALAIRKMKSEIKKNAIRTGNVRSGRSLLLSTTCNRAVSVVCALILF